MGKATYPILVLVALCSTWATAFCDEFGYSLAGQHYGISPILLKAISIVESGQNNSAVNINKNGSMDACHMQINSMWKSKLGDNWSSLSDPVYCTTVGAWVLRQCMERYGYTWDAVACYNTGRSPVDARSERTRAAAYRYIGKVKRTLISIQGNNHGSASAKSPQ